MKPFESNHSYQNPKENSPDSLSQYNFAISELFQAIVEISPISIVITDLKGTILHVSQATLLQHGYTNSQELIGKSAFSLIHQKDHARAENGLKKTLDKGIIRNVPYMLVRKDGSTYPGELTAAIIHDLFGKPVAFIGILRDLSDVLESKERFKFLLENVPAGVGISDPEGKILLANNRMYEIFGSLPGGLSRLNVVDYYINPEDRKNIMEIVRKNREVLNFEAEMKRGNGEKFWASLSLKLLDYSGKRTFITTILDVTDRKKAENALHELYDETVKISETKTHIITYASHELKTPLIPIIGWADFMINAKRKGEDLNKVVDFEELESILRNARRLQRIIDDFLDVGRIQSEKLMLDYESVKLKDIINSAIHTLAPTATERQITIHTEQLEDLFIIVDGFRIEQVLVNLLSNSIKYSAPKKNVWIRTISTETEVAIIVEDEGFGFTPEELEEATQPFSSSFLHAKGEQLFSGTGVGLFICKGIIERHSGTLQITSPGKDKGSKVTILLPRKPHEETQIISS